tara:strand:- start:281 stop:484 length:204 start_codon:yes stop_codon:yes gene_type:complete
MKILRSKLFHLVVRWGLGIHGSIHLFEFVLNIIEGAWASAMFTFIAGILMMSGALIDHQHHVKDVNK